MSIQEIFEKSEANHLAGILRGKFFTDIVLVGNNGGFGYIKFQGYFANGISFRN